MPYGKALFALSTTTGFSALLSQSSFQETAENHCDLGQTSTAEAKLLSVQRQRPRAPGTTTVTEPVQNVDHDRKEDLPPDQVPFVFNTGHDNLKPDTTQTVVTTEHVTDGHAGAQNPVLHLCVQELCEKGGTTNNKIDGQAIASNASSNGGGEESDQNEEMLRGNPMVHGNPQNNNPTANPTPILRLRLDLTTKQIEDRQKMEEMMKEIMELEREAVENGVVVVSH